MMAPPPATSFLPTVRNARTVHRREQRPCAPSWLWRGHKKSRAKPGKNSASVHCRQD
ncbi:hypothetical protein DESPIG_01821 [Desulfovibrio piger ATCC 29098]|uniref:Uncharacterized protein n=1 Tax=Desulfovibrio piger ATCC 29098 TaxID=411464 RepID=B6WUR0_9BACT|nr:hypothetical protein DESPIG_01821 [Desulfovibrio piger ATCC 29098]